MCADYDFQHSVGCWRVFLLSAHCYHILVLYWTTRSTTVKATYLNHCSYMNIFNFKKQILYSHTLISAYLSLLFSWSDLDASCASYCGKSLQEILERKWNQIYSSYTQLRSSRFVFSSQTHLTWESIGYLPLVTLELQLKTHYETQTSIYKCSIATTRHSQPPLNTHQWWPAIKLLEQNGKESSACTFT